MNNSQYFLLEYGAEIVQCGESMIAVERMHIFANKYSQMFNCNKFPSYLNI